MKKLIKFGLLMLFMLVSINVFSQTTIVNEQFSATSDPSGWTKDASGWTYISDATKTYSGTYCARIGNGIINKYFYIPVTFKQNYTYDVDFYVKNVVDIKVVFNETANLTTPLSTYTRADVAAGSTAYKHVICTPYLYSNTNASGYIMVCVTSNNYGSGYAYLDDVIIKETAGACVSPATQSTSFLFSNVTSNSTTLSWTRGDGNNVLIVARSGSAPTDPTNDQTYAASAGYGVGDACGSGFVVYNGSGTSVNVTGLVRNTTYHYAAFEYNTTGTCYNMTQLTGSQLTTNGIGYYYVNDASTSGDIFCSAVGSNTSNYGRGPSTPALTFKWLWNQYGPSGTNEIVDGDVIYVDKGHYISAVAVPENNNYGYNFTQDITIQGAGNTNTIFDNNYCGIAGGFYFADIQSSVTIKDMQFTKYASNSNGQCFQISNTGAPGVVFEDVLTNTNGGSSMYAAIYIGSNSTVNITGGGMNCNGDASHGASGGIDVKGTSITLNVTKVSFIGNYKSASAQIANASGLTITAANPTTDVTLRNCRFAGCQTNDGANGGTIYQTSGDLVMEDCVIEDSQTYQNSVKYGGAMNIEGGTTTMTRCLVQNNTNAGGSTYGNICVNGGALTLTDCKFSGNTSDRGNDVYCKVGTVTATNTAFLSTGNYSIYNSATTILTTCGTPTNTGSPTFVNNDAPSSFSSPSVPSFTGDCASGILLPIELLSFIAECIDDKIYVNWITASETNNNYFVVEKSYNPTNDKYWYFLTKIDGAGNSEVKYYSIEDKTNNGNDYYRLKQVDYDGKYTYSDVVFLKHCQSEEWIKVYPNPTKGEIIIDVRSNVHSYILITITDMIGQVIYEQESPVYDGEGIIRIRSGIFNSKGIYIINLKKDEIQKTEKIVVE